MIHCRWNMATIDVAYRLRLSNPEHYQKFLDDLPCKNCERRLQTLQDEEFRQNSKPQTAKLRFGKQEKRRR